MHVANFLQKLPYTKPLHDDCNFCSTQKCVNRDKIDFASKQHRSQQDSMCHVEQSPIAPHAADMEQFPKLHMTNCSTLQTILSCGAKLLVKWSKIAPHEMFCSTDNVCGVCDNYHVCVQWTYLYTQGQAQNAPKLCSSCQMWKWMGGTTHLGQECNLQFFAVTLIQNWLQLWQTQR